MVGKGDINIILELSAVQSATCRLILSGRPNLLHFYNLKKAKAKITGLPAQP